jgi:hypothetical protein
MSFEPVNHVFLYHAYALALGGWVKTGGRVTPIEGIAPSVLSVAGGFGSASAHHVNTGVRGQYPFGLTGPGDFYVYVGHAYTEVRGEENEDAGEYRTSVRSVLDNVRINDVLSIDHAEAILRSTHRKPDPDGNAPDAEIVVGDSNILGVNVAGTAVDLARHTAPAGVPTFNIDGKPSFDTLQPLIGPHMKEAALVGKGGSTSDAWLDEVCDWHDPNLLTDDPPPYAVNLAEMNQRANSHFRYSLYRSATVTKTTPGVRAYKSSVEVEKFGRIYFGEVFASHGTKQVTMFRLDLGCDNCGGMGGSGGSTNGSTYPP